MDSERHIIGRLRDMYAYRHEPAFMRAITDLYWRILLSIACTVAIFAIWYGVADLSKILSDSESGSRAKTAVKPLSLLTIAELQNTLNGFHAREAGFESVMTSTSSVADPSP